MRPFYSHRDTVVSLNERVFTINLCHDVVDIVHVGLMMFLVMCLQQFPTEDWFKCCVTVFQIWQHDFTHL